MLGEVIGTGIIGSIISYPIMAFLVHKSGLTWFFYTPLFITGTLIGGTIAFVFLGRPAENRDAHQNSACIRSENL